MLQGRRKTRLQDHSKPGHIGERGVGEVHKGQARGAPESQSKGFGLIKVHEIFETTLLKHLVSQGSFYTSIRTLKAQ